MSLGQTQPQAFPTKKRKPSLIFTLGFLSQLWHAENILFSLVEGKKKPLPYSAIRFLRMHIPDRKFVCSVAARSEQNPNMLVSRVEITFVYLFCAEAEEIHRFRHSSAGEMENSFNAATTHESSAVKSALGSQDFGFQDNSESIRYLQIIHHYIQVSVCFLQKRRF